MANAVIGSLELVHSALAGGATTSVTFLSQLLAKFAMIGYGGEGSQQILGTTMSAQLESW